MPDRWNDRQDDRWRREMRHDDDRFGRGERRASDEIPDYLTGPLEGRSFRDHEHDADWDGEYHNPVYAERYEAGPPPAFGRYRRGQAFRRDDEAYNARRPGHGPRGPEWSERGYGAPAEPRPGRFSGFGFGRDLRYGRPDPGRDAREASDEGFFERAADQVASWFGMDEEDDRRRGLRSHRGRGPRGYRRSDERISEDVHDALTDDPYLDASEITVQVASCEVTLSGTVTDREAKHRAERLVERVSGVDHVQNNLRVGSRSPASGPMGLSDTVLEAQAMGETPKTSDRKN